jgi:hypothetical protein
MAEDAPWGLPPSPSPSPPVGQPPTSVAPGLSPPPAPPAASGTGSGDTESAGDPFDDTRPEPGSLHLRGGRAWKTWQLVVAVVVAAVVGMWFNGNTASDTSASASSGGTGGYKLPAPSGSGGSPITTVAGSGSSTSTTTVGGSGSSTSTTTVGGSGSSTSTTTAGGSAGGSGGGATTSPAGLAPATVLVPATQLTGDWTSPVFNIAGGTWNIGWAFACSPVPAATPTFEVFVVNTGASPGPSPAVTSSAPSGQSVTPQTSTGGQQIDVRAPNGCRWAVKVTGSSS